MIGFGDAKPTLFRVSIAKGRRLSFLVKKTEHLICGTGVHKRGKEGCSYPHTFIPSIRPSAHEKETVDRRHRSTFKVTKQDK